MIPGMQQSAGDTMLRALIMAAVLGGIVWVVARQTRIPRLLIQKAISWYDTGRVRAEGPGPSFRSPSGPDGSAGVGAPRLLPAGMSAAVPLSRPTPADRSSSPSRWAVGVATERDSANREAAGTVAPAVAWMPGSEEPGEPTATASPDARQRIEQRLEALGAVYSLLEMWGRAQRRYRYHCQVSFAGGAYVTRSFEANGRSPLEAMQRVLGEVEAWRAEASFPVESVEP